MKITVKRKIFNAGVQAGLAIVRDWLEVNSYRFGEDFVGYDETISRSKQFGTAYLRLAKKLQPGYVFTDEPGIYFIPALIDMWKKENKFSNFINYDKVESYRSFGGIRIEDDLLITADGCRILGKPIPKTVNEIENIVGK